MAPKNAARAAWMRVPALASDILRSRPRPSTAFRIPDANARDQGRLRGRWAGNVVRAGNRAGDWRLVWITGALHDLTQPQ